MRGWAVPFIWAWYGLARDVRGSMAPLIAFGVIVGISGAALSVDLVRGSALQQSLHMAADAAALAAAARLPDTSAATDVALAYVEKNMPAAQYGRVLDPADVEFGLWDPKTRAFTPQSGTATAVRVTTRLSEQNENAVGTFFAGILGRRSIDVAASAIAGRGGAPCVIALDPAAKGSTTLKTNAAIEATGCGVQVNSTTNAALNISGSSSIDASDVCVGGTVSRANSATTTPEPREHCPGQADPGQPAATKLQRLRSWTHDPEGRGQDLVARRLLCRHPDHRHVRHHAGARNVRVIERPADGRQYSQAQRRERLDLSQGPAREHRLS